MDFEKGKILINSFIFPLVWSVLSAKSLNEVESLQKRGLCFLENGCSSSVVKKVVELFKKSGNSTANVSNYQSFCIEIFKTLDIINPSFIKDIFQMRMTNFPTREKYKLTLEIAKSNQVRFGTKSLRYLDPEVWNSLPYHIKSSENLTIFKTLIKIWIGTVCIWKICNKWNYTFTFLLLSFYIICRYVVLISAFWL